MRVACEVRKSEIHGTGVFAVTKIHQDQVVWSYEPGLDREISDYMVRYGDPAVRDYIRERGYINPKEPKVWVLCIDFAAWLNFPKRGESANLCLGGILDGEYLLLAAREIQPGEELTVPPESDLDYERKMSQHESASS